MELEEAYKHCLLKKTGRALSCGTVCERCGWNDEIAEQRKQIPLTRGEDGLRRKILPPRPDDFGNEAGI